MKNLILTASVLCLFAAQAHAMDDAERARQLSVYNAHQATGVGIVTTQTQIPAAPTPMPGPAAAPLQAVAAPVAATTTRQVTSMTTTRSLPPVDNGMQATATAETTAPVALTPAPVRQMSPLNDDGTSMNTPAKAETLGATTAAPASDGGLSSREQQLKAYEAWKAGQMPSANASAPMVVTTPGTTTTETTMTTNYTVTQRKVGLVGNRPYPSLTSDLPGGVVKEVSVNGVAAAPEVITPDTVAPLKDEVAKGDYYSNRRAAQVYNNGSVRVHNTGKFN